MVNADKVWICIEGIIEQQKTWSQERNYKIIKSRIDNFLNENGYLILEIGYDQKEEVQEMFKNSNCIKDYAGNDRVIIWKRG